MSMQRIPLSEATPDSLKEIGLPETPEMVEFVNQIAEAAATGSPLAKPYLDAKVVVVVRTEVSPGIMIEGVGFDKTNFARMVMESTSAYAN